MNPFKSQLRKRAEKMLNDLNRERDEIIVKQQGISHIFEKASVLFYEKKRIETEISVLEQLLK